MKQQHKLTDVDLVFDIPFSSTETRMSPPCHLPQLLWAHETAYWAQEVPGRLQLGVASQGVLIDRWANNKQKNVTTGGHSCPGGRCRKHMCKGGGIYVTVVLRSVLFRVIPIYTAPECRYVLNTMSVALASITVAHLYLILQGGGEVHVLIFYRGRCTATGRFFSHFLIPDAPPRRYFWEAEKGTMGWWGAGTFLELLTATHKTGNLGTTDERDVDGTMHSV